MGGQATHYPSAGRLRGPILVSACLLGVRCRHDGRSAGIRLTNAAVGSGACIVPVCPEQLGGLPTPREPVEIVGGDGHAVLEGRAKVLTVSGIDCTAALIRGSEEVLCVAERLGARCFIGQTHSPSCSCRGTYDGTFRHRLTNGVGVCAALLQRTSLTLVDVDELT